MNLGDDKSSRILALIRSMNWTVTERLDRTKWEMGARKGATVVMVTGQNREQCARHLAQGCGISSENELLNAA